MSVPTPPPAPAQQPEPAPGTLALDRYKRLKNHESKYVEHFEALKVLVKQLNGMRGSDNNAAVALIAVSPLFEGALSHLNAAKETLDENATENDADFKAMLSEQEQQEQKNKDNLKNMQTRLSDRKKNVEEWIKQFEDVKTESKAGKHPGVFVTSALGPLNLDSVHNVVAGYAEDSKPKIAWAETGIRKAEYVVRQ